MPPVDDEGLPQAGHPIAHRFFCPMLLKSGIISLIAPSVPLAPKGLKIAKHDPRPVATPLVLNRLRIAKYGLRPVATSLAPNSLKTDKHDLGQSLVSTILSWSLLL